MKKLNLIFLALVVTLLGACNKPNEDPDPTPELEITKKYLVKQTCDDEEQVVLSIDWSDNHSKVKHIHYNSGSPYYGLDYNFEYYEEDSICVKIDESNPLGSYNKNCTGFTCRMRDGKIDYIVYHTDNSQTGCWYRYVYDKKGNLIQVRGPRYEWKNGNVIRGYGVDPYSLDTTNYMLYEDFDENYNPFYTFPYMLPSFHEYGREFLTEPLWKNNYRSYRSTSTTKRYEYDYDADGYAITRYLVTENGEKLVNFRYFYETEDD